MATFAVLATVVGVGAPPMARLIVALPAAVSAAGYLQAWLRFCAAFGARGLSNFGPLGTIDRVAESTVRGRDRFRAFQIGVASVGFGLAVGLVAVLLPL